MELAFIMSVTLDSNSTHTSASFFHFVFVGSLSGLNIMHYMYVF